MASGHNAGDSESRDARGYSPARPIRRPRTTAGLGSGGLSKGASVPVEKAVGRSRVIAARLEAMRRTDEARKAAGLPPLPGGPA